MENWPDGKLARRVRAEGCDSALRELIRRHSEVCFKTYMRFATALIEKGFSRRDFETEKDILIFRAALSFRTNRGTQFQTWLSQKVRYFCLGKLRVGIDPALLISGEPDKIIDEREQSPEDYGLLLRRVREILSQVKDKRIRRVYELRYMRGDLTTWEKIGQRLKVATQTAINLHSRGRKVLAAKLGGRFCSELCEK